MQTKKGIKVAIIFAITYIIINLIMIGTVQAVEQKTSTQIEEIDDVKYPGIKQMIQNLQKDHPNWKFKILYTGLDWEEVITYEYMGHNGSPKNLVPVTSRCTGDWVCLYCKEDKYYDSGKWRCASETAIQYMMDARNSINNSDVFQFMELTYQEATVERIKKMVTGTFLENDSYINAILAAGKKHNVSPYYIVALAIQEQGVDGSSTISGNYEGYEGYYNIFNINASGNGEGTIITRALSYAKTNGWNSMEASIDGGVSKISTSYIGRGQNTLYFQKFDVENSDGKLYWHQYQQNILAAQNEGVTIRKTFEEINAIDAEYTFVIPVYENMPKEAQGKPSTTRTINTLISDLVRVNVNETIALRETANGKKSGTLYANEIVTRLEKAEKQVNGTYWDKVMKCSGAIGYVARETYESESNYKLYLVPALEEKAEEPNEELGDTSAEKPAETPSENPGDTSTEKPTETPSKNPEETPKDQTTDNPNETDKGETQVIASASNEKIKIDAEAKQITITPETTVKEIVDLIGFEVNTTDAEGKVIGKTTVPATGTKINDEFTIIMLGDASGDGIVDARDSLRILKYSVGSYELKDEFAKAADLNKDGVIDSRDSLRILKYSVQTFEIEI